MVPSNYTQLLCIQDWLCSFQIGPRQLEVDSNVDLCEGDVFIVITFEEVLHFETNDLCVYLLLTGDGKS